MYGDDGAVRYEILPYFSSGTSRTTASGVTNLYTTITRDALGRVTSSKNVVGTTTNTYGGWSATTTDPKGNAKGITKDAFGNIASVTEVNGGIYLTSYTWDALDNLATTTDALGNVRGFVYDGLGRRTQAQDLHSASDTTYGIWLYTYDLNGNLTQTTDPKSQVVNRTYDALNRIATEDYTGSAGTEVTYTYDSCTNGIGRLCVASSTGARALSSYDVLGRVAYATTTIGGVQYGNAFGYDRVGNPTSVTYPNGLQVQYVYGSGGKVSSVLKKHTSDPVFSNIIRAHTYSPLGMPTARGFENGATTTWTFDADELYRLRSIVTATSTVSASSSNTHSLDLERSSSQYAYHADASSYDVSGNLTIEAWVKSESSPAAGEQYTIVSKMHGGSTSNRSYQLAYVNVAGINKIRLSVADAGTTDHQEFTYTLTPGSWYHIAGVFTAASSSYQVFVNGTSVGTSTGTRTSIANSTVDFSVGMQYENPGNTPLYFFDGLIDDVRVWNTARTGTQISGTMSSELIGSESGLVAYYKLNNTYTDATAGANHLTAAGSPVFSTTVPSFSGSSTVSSRFQDISYTYDAAGNITQKTDASNSGTQNTVVYEYDALNRLTLASTTAAPSSPFMTYFNYSELGNLTNMSGTSTVGSANTHALDLERSSSQYAYHTDGSAYDITGNLTIEAYVKLESAPSTNEQYTIVSKLHGGSGTNRSYQLAYVDVSGTKKLRLSIANAAGSTDHKEFNYTLTPATWYHIAGVYTAATSRFEIFINGTSVGTSTGSLTAVGNSTVDFSVGMQYDNPGNTPLYFFDGLIDDVRVWSSARSSANIAANKDQELTGSESTLAAYYQFDTTYTDSTSGANTLTAVNTPAFAAPAAFAGATTTSSSYVYAGTGYANPHAPTSIAGLTLTYDNNGNVTAYGASTTYAWDYLNRMTQSVVNKATTTYSYNHTVQRMSQVTASTTNFYPNKYYSVAGATSTSNIYIGDSLVATIEADGRATTTRYIHADHLGSTNVVTNASGTPVQVLDYLPYGGIRYSSSTAQFNEKHQFIGQYTDSSGLNYLQARYFQGSRGQFLSHDPVFWELGLSSEGKSVLTNPQAMNSYAYGLGNPISYKDPSGRIVYLAVRPVVPMEYHAYYYISPEQGSRFENIGSFTLGGAPESAFRGFGDLQTVFSADSRYGNDFKAGIPSDPSRFVQITPNKGSTEDDLIAALYQGHVAVGKNKTNYNTLGGTSGKLNGNSNNYARTLAEFAGITSQFNQFVSSFRGIYPLSGVPGSDRSILPSLSQSSGIGNTGGGKFVGTYDFGPGIGTYNFGTGSWAPVSSSKK